MLDMLARNWWLLVLRGVFAVLFGILALAWPGITVGALVLVWGVYAIVDGVAALMSAFGGSRSGGSRLWLVLQGLLGIGAGIIAFLWPGLTAVVLLVVIAFWALLLGALQVIAAVRLRKELTNEWLLVLNGVLAIAFGALILFNPGAGALAVVWLLGVWAILEGVVLIALGFRLRGRTAPRAEPRVA